VTFPGVTLAIPLSHARGDWLQRLEVCLHSIEHQTLPAHMIDTVIGLVFDTSTGAWPSRPLLGRLLSMVLEHGVTLVTRTHDVGDWTPALTRNIPARWGRREMVTHVDIDAVLHPEYCEAAYEVLKATQDKAVVTVKTKMTRYPLGAPEYLITGVEAFEAMVRNASGNMAVGTGCGTMVKGELFEEMGGLDERFIGYGPTDWDFTARLKLLGARSIDLTETEGLMLAHQNHPRDIQDAPNDKTPCKVRNLAIMKKSFDAKETTRNGCGWGGLPWPKG